MLITIVGWIIFGLAAIWTLLGIVVFLYEVFRDQTLRQLEAIRDGCITVPAKIVTKQIFPGILVMVAAALMIKYL